MNPEYPLMTKLRASKPGSADVWEGFVIDSMWCEKVEGWVYKLSLEDGSEDFDCWFAEKDLTPV